MNNTTKWIIGGVVLAGVVYFVTRPKAAVVVKPVVPPQNALQQQTALVNNTANTVATAANSLSNLVNSISDATSSDNTSSDTASASDYIDVGDPTLSGVMAGF